MPDTRQEEHFAKAATRHFRDGDYLHRDARLPSADHLYGFAVECAVKSLLLRFTDVTIGWLEGEEVPEDRKVPPQKPRVRNPDEPDRIVEFGHVNELVKEVKLLANGRNGAALHSALDGDLRVFRKWNVKYRYFDDGYAQADVVDRRRDAAHRVLSLHQDAVINKRLP